MRKRTERSRWARTVLAVPALLFLWTYAACGQVDTLWTQFYTGIGGQIADFIPTFDGGFAIGSAKWSGDPNRRDIDFVLVKTDSLGIIEWDSLYAGHPDSVHRNDRVYQMVQMNDGGFLLVGDTRGGPIGMAIRTDSTGRRQWLRYMPQGEVSFHACAITNDNDIVASGGSIAWRLADNDSGAMNWRKRFPPTGTMHHSASTSDGRFIFAGTSNSEEFGGDDFYAVKFDLEGEIEWENYYGTEYLDDAGSVIETHDGGACIVGTQRFGFGDSTNAMIVRVDENGEEIWKRVYDELPRGNFLGAVVETPDGGFAVGGENEEIDFFLMRVDSTGELLWSKSFHRRGSNNCRDVFLMPDGSYVLAGPCADGAWLIRTTPDSLNLPPDNVVLLDPAFPSQFVIGAPYPNPFNNSVRLHYSLSNPSQTSIRIYDQLGHQVAELYAGRLAEGQHSTIWDASGQAAGVYFCKVVAGGNTAMTKVMLVK